MSAPDMTDKHLALDAVRVTEAAALAASRWIGRGNPKAADQAAVDAMRTTLDSLAIQGRIAIGEGERDEAPMLFIGETVGTGHGHAMDIAVDPLEGTDLCANGMANALAVLAIAERGNFLHAPDSYMEKIAVGGNVPEGVVSLEAAPATNLSNLAQAKGCEVHDLGVMVLDRPRHAALIAELREAGARVHVIPDGDVAAIIATATPGTGIDLYVGTGGAPEGVLAAAALHCIGGYMEGRLVFKDDAERERAREMGIADPDACRSLAELASGDIIFVATGVTDGMMLKGVRRWQQGASTHSIVMRSRSGTIRHIETQHNLARKTWCR